MNAETTGGGRAGDELEILAAISRVMTASPRIDDVYDEFARQVKQLLPFDRLSVITAHPDEGTIRTAYTSGLRLPGTEESRPLPGSLTERMMRENASMLVQGPGAVVHLAQTNAGVRPAVAAGFRSLIAAPLAYGGDFVGALMFWSRTENAYSARDASLAEKVGAQIAGAIRNAHLYEHQRETEAALRDSEERFRVMADNLPLVVWLHDAEGRQEFVNQTFCEYFGVSREEMQDDRWQLLTHPDDGTAYIDEFLACVREHRPFHAEVRVRRADGKWRWIESWSRPRFSPTGQFLGHVGTSADITERKEREQLIRAVSTPVLRIRSGLLLLPLVGTMDDARAQQMTDQLLQTVRTERARAIVIDLTGLAELDQHAANRLVQTIEAARLLGAQTIISGISSAVSHMFVQIGVKLEGLRAVADLQGAIEEAGELVRAAFSH